MRNIGRSVYALRILGAAMLITGFVAAAQGSSAATACFCGAASVINASNYLVRKSR